MARTYGLPAAALTLAICLAGCKRDPATEQPVQVKPGMYEAKMTAGFGPLSLSASEGSRRSCVTADEAEHFPQVFTRRYLSMDGACDGPLSERTGNLVTGKMSCKADKGKSLEMTYAAAVGEEAVDVTVEGTMQMSAELIEHSDSEVAKLSRAVKLGVAIKRVGDCEA
jgi:hypothetical protein